ncbi:MAG: ATP-dependent zinc protease [Bacteroidetes bacterium]|nr:ATP-dependent zinc protease [Bacteroidota bacterium]HET6244584.1 RimK/LysX family protein [Bacteroidia bacterium]
MIKPNDKKKGKKVEKIIIGRKELIDLPDLGVFSIQAKIDTGAYSTAFHCNDVYELREGKEKILCFKILDPSHPLFSNKEMQFKTYTRKKIKSSFGQFEKRFVIKTKLIIAGKEIMTEVSLSDRANLKYPVLIGRKVLSKGFIIDVTKVNLTSKIEKK